MPDILKINTNKIHEFKKSKIINISPKKFENLLFQTEKTKATQLETIPERLLNWLCGIFGGSSTTKKALESIYTQISSHKNEGFTPLLKLREISKLIDNNDKKKEFFNSIVLTKKNENSTEYQLSIMKNNEKIVFDGVFLDCNLENIINNEGYISEDAIKILKSEKNNKEILNELTLIMENCNNKKSQYFSCYEKIEDNNNFSEDMFKTCHNPDDLCKVNNNEKVKNEIIALKELNNIDKIINRCGGKDSKENTHRTNRIENREKAIEYLIKPVKQYLINIQDKDEIKLLELCNGIELLITKVWNEDAPKITKQDVYIALGMSDNNFSYIRCFPRFFNLIQ